MSRVVRWLLLVSLSSLVLPSMVSADEPTTASARPVVARAPSGAPRPAYPLRAKRWTGPRVELSYRLRSLSDSAGGGSAQTAAFAGFLPTRQFRGGGGVEAGARAYAYGASEGLVSGYAFAGYQHLKDLGRFVPYLVAIGEVGALLGKRFHTPVTRLLRGAGVELGCDVNLVRTMYVGLGASFMMYTLDGLAYRSFGLRVSLGL